MIYCSNVILILDRTHPFLCSFSHYRTVLAILQQTAIIWLPTQSVSTKNRWIQSVRRTRQNSKQWNNSVRINLESVIHIFIQHHPNYNAPNTATAVAFGAAAPFRLNGVAAARAIQHVLLGEISCRSKRIHSTQNMGWIVQSRDQGGHRYSALSMHPIPACTSLPYYTIFQLSDLTLLNNRLSMTARGQNEQ